MMRDFSLRIGFTNFFLAIIVAPIAGMEQAAPVAKVTAGTPKRIDPAGIVGSLVLAGDGDLSSEIVGRFFKLAGGAKAHVVVVTRDSEIKSFWDKEAFLHKAKVLVVSWEKLLKSEMAHNASISGIWLEADVGSTKKRWREPPLRRLCDAVLGRGGVIGTSGKGVEALAHDLANRDVESFPYLPDAILRLSGEPKADHPGLLWIEIERDTALVVEGRRLFAVGVGAAAIHLANRKGKSARAIVLKGKMQEDLTALRRAARSRAEHPVKVGQPFVAKGTLVIVGGGGYPAGLMERFVELAGGAKSQIVILPTANPDPLPAKNGMEDLFRKAGAGKVSTLRGRTLAEVEGPESLTALRSATGIWFGGGRQWRFVDAYEGTKALTLMRDVLERGGVIGGTSAGATIQGEYLCRASPFENTTMMAEGYERGFAFLPGVAIDQHFSQRKRLGDMTSLMQVRRDLLGIGIDETTGIVVRGSVAEVVGKGSVYFYDPMELREHNAPDYERVEAGGSFDLKSRRVVK